MPSLDKQAVMDQVRAESAMTNARQLIEKVNEHCFEKCVPKPSTSLSSGDTTCFTQCMDKYLMAWNAVNKHYVARIQEEVGKAQGGSV